MKFGFVFVFWAWLLFWVAAVGTFASARDASVVSNDEKIHIVWVSCGSSGSRIQEVLTSIRSVLLFHDTNNPIASNSNSRLYFHVIVDQETTQLVLEHTLARWQASVSFSFQTYQADLPDAYQNLFAPCACQRLFLHQILSIDRVIYIDTDTLMLADVSRLHNYFQDFGQERIAAAVAEHEATQQAAYYKDEATHPYYQEGGVHGLNSGVLLLDLERIRNRPWNEELEGYRLSHPTIQFYDQDLLNIYFAAHPERLLLLPCSWNYRPDHCFYRKHCESIHLIHGNRGVFHKTLDKSFAVASFSFLYHAFANEPGVGDCTSILNRFQEQINPWMGTEVTNNCEAVVFPVVYETIMNFCQKQQLVHAEPEL